VCTYALNPTVRPKQTALVTQARAVDWQSFVHVPEIRAVHRRMLQVSDKLREAIAMMEDEGLEDDWSDALATAQRQLFAAQAPEAYFNPVVPSGSKRDVPVPTRTRERTMQLILRANSRLDGLLQGEDDWIGAEEEDRDRDLCEEVIIANARAGAWLVPATGTVNSFDYRARHRNVLDVARGRDIVCHCQGEGCCGHDGSTVPSAGMAMGADATVVEPSKSEITPALPVGQPYGIVSWLLEADTTPAEVYSGAALDLLPNDLAWDVQDNAIDEEGDCSYTLRLAATTPLRGRAERSVVLERRFQLPFDAARLSVEQDVLLQGSPEVLLATQIPVRLRGADAALFVDGEQITLEGNGATARNAVLELSVRGEQEDEHVTVRFTTPTDVWCYFAGAQDSPTPQAQDGLVAVAVCRVTDSATLGFAIEVGALSELGSNVVVEESVDEVLTESGFDESGLLADGQEYEGEAALPGEDEAGDAESSVDEALSGEFSDEELEGATELRDDEPEDGEGKP
jgi:hypothetical protein